MGRKMSLFAGAALVAAASGCGGIGPGDYLVFRVASADQELSSGCPSSLDEDDDSTTIRASSTLILYAGADGELFLDTGEVTLAGEYDGEATDGEAYQFSGQVVDVEWSDPTGQGTKWVSSVKHGVDLAIDGAVVTGTARQKTSQSCSGPACGTLAPTCTVTVEFVGSEIDDVVLEHVID